MLIRGGVSRLRAFLRDESGTSSAEYALILGVVGVGVGAATLVLGANVGSSMNGKVGDFDVAYAGSTKGGGGSAGGGSSGGGTSGGGSSGGGSTGGGTGSGGSDAGSDTGTGNGNGNGNGNGGGNGNGKNKP